MALTGLPRWIQGAYECLDGALDEGPDLRPGHQRVQPVVPLLHAGRQPGEYLVLEAGEGHAQGGMVAARAGAFSRGHDPVHVLHEVLKSQEVARRQRVARFPAAVLVRAAGLPVVAGHAVP